MKQLKNAFAPRSRFIALEPRVMFDGAAAVAVDHQVPAEAHVDAPATAPTTLVVIDSRLETPLDAALFIAGRKLLIYAAVPDAAKQAALEARGATVVMLTNPDHKVDLAAMLRDLARREINELHVEAGEKLNGSLIREGLVDEFVVYLAPKLIGQGRGMAHFGPLQDLTQAVSLEFKSTAMLGPDLRVLARVCGRDVF